MSAKKDDEDEEKEQDTGIFSFFKPTIPGGTSTENPLNALRAFADNKAGSGSNGFFGVFSPAQTQKGNKSQKGGAKNTVFVAGATGRLGIRVVRELLAAGYSVRAGVRSEEKAEGFGDQLAELAAVVGPLSRQDENRVKIVFCDLTDPETIAPAIGNASRVVCCVGAAESEFTNLSAPKLIDFEGTERLINTAAALGNGLQIEQFILVTSLGTGKFGFPAGVLNLFGGILIYKRKAEEVLESSGLKYLIVRPGGMERPKDDHKLTHNVLLQKRDTLFGGTLSRLQIAELITVAIENPDATENKTVEVVAETKAPKVDYAALLENERSEIPQELRLEALEEVQEVRTQLEAAKASLQPSKEQLKAIRESVNALQSQAAEARAEAKEAQKEQGAVLKSAEQAEKEVERLRARADQTRLP